MNSRRCESAVARCKARTRHAQLHIKGKNSSPNLGNALLDEGARLFSAALATNSTLTFVDLSGKCARALAPLQTIQVTPVCPANKITSSGETAIADGLARNSSL